VFWLPPSSAEYGNGISFFTRFYYFAVVIEVANLFFFVVCACSIFCYIWTRARASNRFIFFKILSLGRIIAKMTLSDSLLFKAFRDFFD
jgi:hypothetical protein